MRARYFGGKNGFFRAKKILYFVPVMTGAFCLFATGSAVGAEAIKLNPSVEQSLRQHPNVAEAKARVCQVIHRLGLDKARARPQVSLSISGGRQLIERVKGANGRPDDRGSAESGYIVNRSGLRVRDPSVDDDDISGAYSAITGIGRLVRQSLPYYQPMRGDLI